MVDEVDRTEDVKADYKPTHSFYIAGVQHHQGMKEAGKDISVGDNLLLVPEPSNPYDHNAIRIEYATFEKQAMLGYVPKKFSSEVSAKIEVGKTIECVVTHLDLQAKPWEMCKVEVREVI